MSHYFVEVTDTYGGEANYCWVRRYKVKATTMRGAVSMVAKHEGLPIRKVLDTGDFTRHDVPKCCICMFTQGWDEQDEGYNYKELPCND